MNCTPVMPQWHVMDLSFAFCSVRCMFFVHRNCRFSVQLMKTVRLLYSFLEFMSKTQITHDTNPTLVAKSLAKRKLKVIVQG